MKIKKTSVFFTAACFTGFVTAYLLHQQPSPKAEIEPSVVSTKSSRHYTKRSAENPEAPALPLSKIRSKESLESLISYGESAPYGTLALWLLDADSANIAAYWASCKDINLHKDTKQLVILCWARIDPQAAIAATSGTKLDYVAWWAWSAYDPSAAMAAADSKQLKHVVRGIGEFHPKWLKEHFDQIPKELQSEALKGLTTWKEDSDPLDSLRFLKKQGKSTSDSLFQNLALRDPWAAFDWLKENNQLSLSGRSYEGERSLKTLLDAMKLRHPEDLERLAAVTPPGALKRKIEEAYFSHLLETDPEAALKRAKAEKAPLIAAQRFGELGKSYLSTDLEKAFEIASEILSLKLQELAPQRIVKVENGSSSWGAENNSAQSFLKELTNSDPERTLEMIRVNGDELSQTFALASQQWAQDDLSAFTEWVDRQTDDIKKKI